MLATVQKWGGSQGVRLPKATLDAIGVHVSDKVDIEVKDNVIVISKVEAKKHMTLEERDAEFMKANPDFKFDDRHEMVEWGEPVGKEVW